ncbi:hypothetical protein FZEAL_3596 [Fusarium zealandicum]|uniref:Globin-sensor domain-containing protein n=1 Tax=Fusarium zealandicum TaxID=1053134 RepID=A0A8H4UNH0_9HYPO|nr:hypothetical protein FZEAL_3596 [Fusarium zealandicum]
MATSRPMKHIDREDLYTNLEARVQYLHSFLDFSSRDIEALITGAKYVKALIPAVVNIVYKKLLQYDITARAFTTRSTSFEGPLDDVPDENSPQILHRKMFLRAYLMKLCSDPSKMEFWEYLDKVGMMHVGLGRKHPLHIEYVHLGVCLGFIQDIMTEAILSHPRLHIQRKTALVKALNKVIWIQNDLMAKWHVKDGAEYETGGDSDIEIEREGYLHGKRIIGEGNESSAEEDAGSEHQQPRTPSRIPHPSMASGGVCPFTGAGAPVEDEAN